MDAALYMHTKHRTLMVLKNLAFDAYREEYEMHLNAIVFGSFGETKSFCIAQLDKMLVDRTVRQIDYTTEHATEGDEDDNDFVEGVHEAPEGLFNKNKLRSSWSPGVSRFKNRLTRLIVVSRTLQIEEGTGRRWQREAVSSCIGVHIIATNGDPEDLDVAWLNRFLTRIHDSDIRADGVSILELTQAARLNSTQIDILRQDFFNATRIQQVGSGRK